MAEEQLGPRRDFFKYQLYLLNKLGMWEDCSSRMGKCLYQVMYIFLVVPLVIHITCAIVPFLLNMEDRDIGSLTESLSLIGSTTKIVWTIIKQKEIKAVLAQLKQLYARTDFAEGVAILNRCEGYGRVLTVAMYASNVTAGFLFVLGPTVPALIYGAEAQKLPFKVWYPFDVGRHYWLAVVIQTFMICSGISATALDTLYIGIIVNVCGQLKVLQVSLRKIQLEGEQEETTENSVAHCSTSVENPRSGDESDRWKKIQSSKWSVVRENPTFRKNLTMRINMQRLRERDSEQQQVLKRAEACLDQLIACKHTHTDILRVTADIQKILSPVLFVQFLVNSLVLCLVTCKLTVTANNSTFDSKLAYMMYLVVALYQIGFYCWFGSELIHQGEEVSVAAYATPWCRLPREYRRSLMLVMMRAQSQIRLSGAQLYSVRLETFISVCMASASYFSVLREKLLHDMEI